jgi:hypothetical protein
MLNKSVLTLTLVLIIALIGYKTWGHELTIHKNAIATIKLVCLELCKQKGNAAFSVKTIEADEDLEMFAKAINKAEKLQGILDYGALFEMDILFKDGALKKYDLIIEKEYGAKGLLVESTKSSQGYTISQELSFELSKIIYQ